MKPKFYYCENCGNLVVKLIDSGVTPVCCAEHMIELKPNETDSVKEKHLPVINCTYGGTVRVTVGEKLHPMAPEHLIQLIVLETEDGVQVKNLHAGSIPHAEFTLAPGDKPLAVYAYCNIHGLWMSKCK